jgi:SOS response regulatory protein OraA/RecX
VLDDKRFAEWAADRSARKNKSFRVASNELRSKGIDVATIAETVAIDDMTALVAIINKVSGRPRYSDQKKLIAYLLSKGFLYNDIRRVLSLQAPEQGL